MLDKFELPKPVILWAPRRSNQGNVLNRPASCATHKTWRQLATCKRYYLHLLQTLTMNTWMTKGSEKQRVQEHVLLRVLFHSPAPHFSSLELLKWWLLPLINATIRHSSFLCWINNGISSLHLHFCCSLEKKVDCPTLTEFGGETKSESDQMCKCNAFHTRKTEHKFVLFSFFGPQY